MGTTFWCSTLCWWRGEPQNNDRNNNNNNNNDMAMKLVLFLALLGTCHLMDIEFHSKVESDTQDDWFGVNIASNDEVVVVGAPSPKHGNGSATVNHEGKS